MSLSELSIKRPTFIVVIFTLLTLLGIISYKSLRYELTPNMEKPIFTVVTIYPGANPSEVENSVTKVLEEKLSGVPGVVNIRGTSRENTSIIIVEVSSGTDIGEALNEGQRLANAARIALPDGAYDPSVTKININALPVLNYAVRADNISATELHDLLTYRILPEFSSVPGVGEVSITASSEREIQVNVDPLKLETQNLSILQVVNTVRTNNLNFPAGNIRTDSLTSAIRLSAEYESIDDIANAVIKRNQDGTLLKVGDVAEVIDAVKDVKGYYRLDGQPAVGLSISKQDDANTVEVVKKAKEKAKMLEERYKEQGLKFGLAMDGSVVIQNAADSVIFDLTLAIIFVTILMLFFLRSIRNSIIVMISVPLSIVATFIGLSVMDFSLNLITLLALCLMIGNLVDDAIVVLENIYRHMEMGKNPLQASIDGIKEIGLSVVSLTLTLLVVFIPLAFTEGAISSIFKAFALTMSVSLIVSLFVAFTVVPLMTAKFGKLTEIENKGIWGSVLYNFEMLIAWFRNIVMEILEWALNNRLKTLSLAALLLALSIALFPLGYIGFEMMADGDNNEVNVSIEFVKDISISQNNEITREIEGELLAIPEVASVYASVGAGGSQLSGGDAFKSSFGIKLADRKQRERSSEEFASYIERHI